MRRSTLTRLRRLSGLARPKKKSNVLRWTARAIGGLSFGTATVSVYQYIKLRSTYQPLTPPKGAVSGVELPLVSKSDGLDSTQILFVGDSLVIGIGCPDRSEGPVFARHISRIAAQTMQKRVKWRVMGVDGGDVNSMRENLMEEVKRAVGPGNPKVSAVVIMCGLNDYKALIQEGRLPSMFKEDLRCLIRSIKDIVGEEVRVVLPALPVDRAPLFKSLFPMNVMLYKVAKVWDHQKRLLSGEELDVEFVVEPEDYVSDDWAVDGIHPSEKGYTKWADHIIHKMLPRLVQKLEKKPGAEQEDET
mmetsp:Transcript_21723/g.38553  ORF Transcript_21723/g.38553 Transcript_21723/m.38553 type:complete len:303 (-) Transcript_21723:85-993(-)|eukprot:CAMPEP_0197529780 /NCGR_PEP_ID=MMETSP1318-20131121/29624_1 /TAXON_ID=552666 /ORGANISM="Partenskyella glossopodia, Strain RCC365" /LENGTH=302 /DNA_ID=CAMNT_0043085377 /DNA_START=26 /DNA_END=934 /DNA_ORIENTATION=+